MNHILNTGRYDVAFEVEVGGKRRTVEFDRRRLFYDTGNVAVSGITAVEDSVFKALEQNRRFAQMLADKQLSLVDPSELKGQGGSAEALEKENAELKKKLAEAKAAKPSASAKAAEKKLAEKEAEISELKARLESLAKAGADSEAEGF